MNMGLRTERRALKERYAKQAWQMRQAGATPEEIAHALEMGIGEAYTCCGILNGPELPRSKVFTLEDC